MPTYRVIAEFEVFAASESDALRGIDWLLADVVSGADDTSYLGCEVVGSDEGAEAQGITD